MTGFADRLIGPLDVFRGAYAPDEKRPRIHVYCFTCAEEADAEDDILRVRPSSL